MALRAGTKIASSAATPRTIATRRLAFPCRHFVQAARREVADQFRGKRGTHSGAHGRDARQRNILTARCCSKYESHAHATRRDSVGVAGLGKYVREKHVVSLMDALSKMSLQPAKLLHLPGKGRLQVGADADITVFDPQRVTDRATYENRLSTPVASLMGW